MSLTKFLVSTLEPVGFNIFVKIFLGHRLVLLGATFILGDNRLLATLAIELVILLGTISVLRFVPSVLRLVVQNKLAFVALEVFLG